MPNVASFGALLNPNEPSYAGQSKDIEAAARGFNRKVYILNAVNEADIDHAFSQAKELDLDALVIGADPFFLSRREQIVNAAERLSIPTIYGLREYVSSGGLLSYGTNLRDAYRQVGIYTGRILKGEKAADLPVIQATRFELVINLKTAKALSLDIPAQLLAVADEVIE
jgi:putative tryptophan/tyrosine transport system substrate-binding protein